MEINYVTMVATWINFVILVLILKHFFWDKVKEVIAERKEFIEDQLLEVEEEAEKARFYLVENQRILNSAKKEGKKIVENKKDKASKKYKEIIEEANKEAKIIMNRARTEIGLEREKAQYELKKEAVNIAINLSTKALEENIEESKQRQLISEFITKVGK